MNTLPSPNAGIATGNPQPLPTQQPKQQKPQQFDLSQYPDLATALHAMKVVQDEKAKQVQQGLQAGQMAQQQPPVIQQINMALQKIAAEREPVPVPVPVRGGKGVDTLPTNLGENYAGGGIVAFSEGGRDTEQTDDLGFLPGEGIMDRAGRRLKNFIQWINSGPPKYSNASNSNGADMPPPIMDIPSSGGPHNQMPAPAVDDRTPRDPNVYRPYGIPAALDVPPVSAFTGDSGKTRVSASGPGKYDPEDFTTQVQKTILEEMRADPRARADADTESARKLLGMEPILAQQRARAADVQALMDKQREVRSPMQQWLTGFATAKPGGGLGLAAANAAGAYDTAQQGWAKEDLTNKLTVNKMLDDIDKAQLTGNEKLVQARTQALADYVREKTGAIGAGAQESSRIESAKLRLQQAAIAHQNAIDNAKGREDNKTLAILQQGYNQAHQEAEKNTAIAAKSFAANLSNMGKEFDAPSYYADALDRALNNNAAYAHAQQKLGITPIRSTTAAAVQSAPMDLSKWGKPQEKAK